MTQFSLLTRTNLTQVRATAPPRNATAILVGSASVVRRPTVPESLTAMDAGRATGRTTFLRDAFGVKSGGWVTGARNCACTEDKNHRTVEHALAMRLVV